jgi:hypothetical protein
MLRFIVDWVGRKLSRPPETVDVIGNAIVAAEDVDAHIEVGHESPAAPLQVLDVVLPEGEEPSPSELGIRFQRKEFRKLLKAVGHWPSVELMTASGRPIESMRDVPKGADGGIDAVIRIVTDTEHGARVVAGKIRRMIVQQAY